MVDVILLIAGILFLIPFVIQFRLYLFIKSNSYLRFSILFLLVFIDTIITAFQSNHFLLQVVISFSFTLTFVILITITMEILDQNFPISRVQWWLIGAIIFVGTIIMKYLIETDVLPPHYTSLRIAYGEVLEFTTGLMIVYSFSKLQFIQKTNRTSHIRLLWLIVGFILIFDGLMTIIVELIRFYYIENGLLMSTRLSYSIDLIDIIVNINVLLISILVMVFAIFYPETLLLSMDQIYKASKLYELISTNSSEPSSFFSEDIILDYLNSLPDDIFPRKD